MSDSIRLSGCAWLVEPLFPLSDASSFIGRHRIPVAGSSLERPVDCESAHVLLSFFNTVLITSSAVFMNNYLHHFVITYFFVVS